MKEKTGKKKKSTDYQTDINKNIRYVSVGRNWKEYLGESLLIVFSVLLALSLTEYINKVHDQNKTAGLINNIVDELHNNQKAIGEIQEYNLMVLRNIDSVLSDKDKLKNLVTNSEFHLGMIAPKGILYRYLESDAWNIAKNNDIMSKIDLESLSLLARVYEDLGRISKVEDEVAKIIFNPASRDPNQARTTLILIKDVYHGWAIDRVPGLLSEIEKTTEKLKSVKH
jgi:hypothetical protein